MSGYSNNRGSSNRFVLHGVVCLSLLVALAVMTAWFMDARILMSLGTEYATMKFNTALCFLLLGIALLGAIWAYEKPWARSLAGVASIIGFTLGILTLIEYSFDINFGIDQAFVRDALTSETNHPGRMSIATAVGFALLCSSIFLVLSDRSRLIVISQIMALTVCIMAFMALVGYLLKPSALYAFDWFRSVAVHTAALFMMLSVGTMMLHTNAGIIEPISSPLIGGRSARRFLPVTILLPILCGWALVSCIDAGILGDAMAFNIFVVFNTLIISLLVWIHALRQNMIHSNLLKQNDLLRKSEQANELLAAIVTHTSNAIVCVDEDNRVSVWNRGAVYVFGIESSDAVGHPLSDVIPTELLDSEWLERARRGESISGKEFTLSRKDGKCIVVTVSISPVRNEMGSLIGVSIIGHDITEIRQVESERDLALRDLVDFKTALDEHAIVAITDPRGRITYTNEKFCAISKYSRDELIGKDHRLVNSGYHTKEFFQNLWDTISRGEVWHGEIRNITKDGDFYWVDTTIVPFLDDDGKPRQYIAIRADITELKRSTAALSRQAEELMRSNADLEQFAYIASHDLQEPLRGIDGCVQLLARRYREKLDAAGQEFIDHTVGNVSRMQRLIRDLLSYSRVGTVTREFHCIKLADVVSDAMLNLASSIEESNATITVDELPMIHGDRTQLSQVFQNLLSNALKFRVNEPKIQISAQSTDGYWDISVSDNGIGIGPEYFKRIFVIFQRLHNRDEYDGTGIGLALCKRILQHHSGRIWLESQPGEGSVFHLVFRQSELPSAATHQEQFIKERCSNIEN